jgi:hypothetical protein
VTKPQISPAPSTLHRILCWNPQHRSVFSTLKQQSTTYRNGIASETSTKGAQQRGGRVVPKRRSRKNIRLVTMLNTKYLRIVFLLLTVFYIVTLTKIYLVEHDVTNDSRILNLVGVQEYIERGVVSTTEHLSSISSLKTTPVQRTQLSRKKRHSNNQLWSNNNDQTNATTMGTLSDVRATGRVALNEISMPSSIRPLDNANAASSDDGSDIVARSSSREKLQLKLDRIVSTTGSPYQGRALWEVSDYLPPWMKEYFQWHTTERSMLSYDSWQNGIHKIMVLQCPFSDNGNGRRGDSLSQRFTIIPYLLREAYEMKRLVFIHWTDPTNLEEFLVPPIGGIDWRTPKWLQHAMVRNPSFSLVTFLAFV